MKCPCNKCICLAVCIHQNSVKTIVDKCHLLAKYIAHDITSHDNAEKAVEILKPKWYMGDTIATTSKSFKRNSITNIVHHARLLLNEGWRSHQ